MLGADDSELARLITQAEIHRPEAEALLNHVPIDIGARAIDVGCGPLGVLDLLSERVGGTGEVVGLDNESRMLALAQRSIAERELRNVTLLQADAFASELPAESFDLAHERLVLNNATAPEALVREMVRVVRPGGWVALQDVDWITWTCEPVHPAWNELLAALTAARQAAGLDPFIGRRLPALLRHAGMEDIDVRAHQYIWRPGDLSHSLLITFVAIHRKRIINGGYLTSERIDELTAELERHLAQPDTLVIYTPLFQAWGRKPYDLPAAPPGAELAWCQFGDRSALPPIEERAGAGRGSRLSLLEEIFDPFLGVDPITSALADPSVWFLREDLHPCSGHRPA